MKLSHIAISVLLSVGVLAIAIVIILTCTNNKDNFRITANPKPNPKSNPKPTSSCPVSNSPHMNALNGFGNPVTWWAIIKLPSSVLTASDYFGNDVLTKGDIKNNWVANGNDEFGFMRMINTGKSKCSKSGLPCTDNSECAGEKCQAPSTFTSYPTACQQCYSINCTTCAPGGMQDLWEDQTKKGSPLSVKNRAKGLCYIYADSNNPKFSFFTAIKSGDKTYECLGQGGNDPLSQTLRQIYTPPKGKKPQWAFWSDQSYQPADSWIGSSSFPDSLGASQNTQNTIYPHPHSGCSRPGAHSKGAIGYDENGGFLLQSSFPMYPDFSFMNDPKPGFVKLGCQLDNNVNFAQAAFCFSFPKSEAPKIQSMFKSALICSKGSPSCTSEAADSQNSGYGIGNYLKCHSDNLDPDWNDAMNYGNYKKGSDTIIIKASVNGGSNPDIVNIQAVAKSQYDTQPPWAIVAQAVDSDLSVLSWWSPDYGAPSICKDTDYNIATNKFCLGQSMDFDSDGTKISQPLWPFGSDGQRPGDLINSTGYPRHNIEMILSLKLDPSNVPGIGDIFKYEKNGKTCEIAWPKAKYTLSYQECIDGGHFINNAGAGFFTLGGVFDAGNHCKLGLSTPSDGKPNKNLVIFGDMNQEGYPGVINCTKSQYGRGGLFFAISNKPLWQSFYGCVNKVCACSPDSIGSHRFCGQGSYPGLVWWDRGASTSPTEQDLPGPSSTHRPWYFRQMSTDECKKFLQTNQLNGTDATACIGTGYQEFGDYYNPGFDWPKYGNASVCSVSGNSCATATDCSVGETCNISTSFWENSNNGNDNVWKWRDE